MQVLDASAIISGWEAYEQFPSLWIWLAEQIDKREIVISEVAFEEVKKNHPTCAAWLIAQEIQSLPVTDAVAQEAMRIKGLLGIVAEKYGRGVGENDLLIIATAKFAKAVLLTDEKRQPILPAELRNYRIPTVGSMSTVDVTCMSFVEMIKASGQIF